MAPRVTVTQQQPITVKVKTGTGAGFDQLAREIANAAYSEANSRTRLAFSTINVANQTSITADSNSDTFTLIQGSGILIETDAANDSVLISATGGAAFDQFARDTANSSVRFAYVTIAANGTSLIPNTNTEILYLTSVKANGIRVSANSETDTIDIGLEESGANAGSYGDSTTLVGITIDALGRVLGISNVAPSFNASVITSGTLPSTRGGTGFSSFANGEILVGNTSSGLLDKLNVTGGVGVSVSQNANTLSISSNLILPVQSKAVSYGYPLLNETITLFYTNTAITFSEVRSVVVGQSPNITFRLIYTNNRSDIIGTTILANTVCVNTSTGISNTEFIFANVPANNFICLTTVDKSGSVDELSVTMFFTN